MIGIGGAPTRATTLPEGAADRKTYPVASGFTDYFPDAIVAVAHISWRGNEQHNAGMPIHWNRSKSGDEADTLMRHFLQRGTLDTDGVRHSAKLAWRALALLQKEIEAEQVDVDAPLTLQECKDAIAAVSGIYDPAIKNVDTVLDDHDHAGYVPANKIGLTPDDRYGSAPSARPR